MATLISHLLNALSPQSGRHWYEDVCIFNVLPGPKFSLVGWLAGEAANVMESLPAEEVKDVLHELLVLFLGEPELPAPTRLVRWVLD